MRVLIVTPEYPPDSGGGIGSFYSALVPALEANGCEVAVLRGSAFSQGRGLNSKNHTKISVLEQSQFERWLDRFNHLAMFPMLRRHLAAAFAMHEQVEAGDGYDVVEVTDWGFLFLPWLSQSRARVLVQLHGSCGQISRQEPVAGHEAEGLFGALLEKIGFASAPALSSYSRLNVKDWERLLNRTVEYWPPPVSAPSQSKPQSSRDGGWVTVGRIQRWKGTEVACAAWKNLGENAPPLTWFGRDTLDGASGRSTNAMLHRRFPEVWGSRITPKGSVSKSQIGEAMRGAKAVLIPSTWDVFNLAAAEAMAAGKPLVISDGAGASELIQDGNNGIVFTNGDAEALARAVKRIESLSETELTKMGTAAAATVTEKLNPERIAAARKQLYANLSSFTAPESAAWLRDLLLPAPGAKPLRFLDGLPLKDVTKYVMRRGLAKSFGG
jgi:glycosyltransferase involved in cell wall biosynthesis